MSQVLGSVALLLGGALASALAASRERLARAIALAALGGALLLGLPAAVRALSATPAAAFAWSLPGASFRVALDPLSACFLLLVLVVCGCAGIFGEGYLAASRGHLPAAPSRFFFLLLAAAMALLVCARNAVLFLMAWEVMALAAFFLVSAEHAKAETRRAALVYLLCAHTGSLCLLGLFALLGSVAGSLDFDAFAAAAPALGAARQRLALGLAVAGFGLKAGLVPLHLWLQEAHPAAPSHASAAMSGVMIEMGVYGLLRTFSLLSPIPRGWGVLLLVGGLGSTLFGVLFAMVQRDLKRVLAYSSIENVGIILIGLGLGYIGLADEAPALAVLGFGGALLHTLNHGLFKSLLFLSAGALYQALGTRDIEAGGGLLRRMPWTGLCTWIGAAAICGLPPLNGFAGEWLLYRGLLQPEWGQDVRLTALTAAGLALAGGLAAVAFTRAYGALLLGSPRTEAARSARDPAPLMLGPMIALSALCLGIGLFPGPAVRVALAATGVVTGASPSAARPATTGPLASVAAMGGLALALGALLWALRGSLLRRRPVAAGPTWACGFTAPSSRQQYTASSFSVPAARAFASLLGAREQFHAPAGCWPQTASFRSAVPDPVLDRWLPRARARVDAWVSPARGFQHGRLQAYLLYVSAFLVLLLLWKL
ncbi:MAG: oxidoreductase [Elusimicrobia bacterium]|nr:oxidoreductase [Elusimicrobiota bacterium]